MGSKGRKRKAPSHPVDDDEEVKPSKHALIAEAANEAADGRSDQSEPERATSIQEMSDVIAELSESVLENPHGAFKSASSQSKEYGKEKGSSDTKQENTPSPVAQLLSIARAQETPEKEHTAHLAILSLLAIFKDIIPDYRIRLPTDKEMAVKVSKDTKELWDFERGLLHNYQQFLKVVEKTWENKGKGRSQPSKIALVSIMSMSELLKAAFHFNYRSNLLTAVIRPMNHPIVGDHCCSSIAYVLANDSQGDVALEAARQVSKMILNRKFNVRPAVLRTFVSLPLRVHVDEAQAAKLAAKAKAKRKKKDKELASIEAELKEGEATVDKIALARNQADALEVVTIIYFRILKSDNLNALQKILPTALEGLAKFAHLINIDTVMDLLAVLKELLKNVDELPLDAALNCILTAFSTLQGPGQELKIDQKEYVLPLYSQIPRITSKENSLKHTEILLQCLQAAFVKQKEYNNVRVAAFVKQILTACLHSPAYTAVPLLAFCRQLFQRYPSAQQLLENEADVITSGAYTPDVEDPEQSNPYATSGWELATLQFHIHPAIASQANAATTNKMLQLPGEAPDRLRKQTLEDAGMLYISFQNKHVLKKHPLHQKPVEGKNKKQRPRFIAPRQFPSLVEALGSDDACAPAFRTPDRFRQFLK